MHVALKACARRQHPPEYDACVGLVICCGLVEELELCVWRDDSDLAEVPEAAGGGPTREYHSNQGGALTCGGVGTRLLTGINRMLHDRSDLVEAPAAGWACTGPSVHIWRPSQVGRTLTQHRDLSTFGAHHRLEEP